MLRIIHAKGSLIVYFSPPTLFLSFDYELVIVFQGGKVNSIDFHRKDDLLVTSSEDDSVRLYDIANAK